MSDEMAAVKEDPQTKQQIAAIGRVLKRQQSMPVGGPSTPSPAPPSPPAPPPPSPPTGPPGVVVPHPGNHFDTIIAVHAADTTLVTNACVPSGGSWAFMDQCVEALRAVDPRFSYNCKRGDCSDPSVDAVFYYGGPDPPANGRTEGWIFDIIQNVCPPNSGARPGWIDVTAATLAAGTTGGYLYPRP
jgi:hypothetical protein